MTVFDIYEKCLPKNSDYPDSIAEYIELRQRCAKAMDELQRLKHEPKSNIMVIQKIPLGRRVIEWIKSVEAMGLIIGLVGSLIATIIFWIRHDWQSSLFMGAIVIVALLSFIPSLLRKFVER